jgi:type I restriction enzyme, S subunit
MNKISEGWRVLTLADLVVDERPICYGVLKPGEFVSDGVPLIRIVDLVNDQVALDGLHRISNVLDAEFHRSKLLGGEVLVSIQGTIGRVAVAPPELSGANISRTIARLAPNHSVSASFLSQWLRSPYGQRALGDSVLGTTRDSLNIGVLRQVRLAVPSIPEQRRIAEILDTADEEIRSTERLIATLERAKQGLIHDLLTRGIDENGHLRDSEKLRSSSVGLIPSSWSIGPLRSYLVLQRGFDITVAEQRPGNVPVVSSSGISSFHDCAMVKGPGVVIGRKGKLGDAYYIAGDFWPHDTSLWVKQFKNVVPEFAAVLLKSMRLERFDAATSVPTLNRNFIHPILIVVPPAEEQIQILKTLDAASCRIRCEKENLTKLRLVKRGLMHDLLTGRVRAAGASA